MLIKLHFFFLRMSASQMLEAENKKMEEKLKVVQNLMNAEREKRSS